MLLNGLETCYCASNGCTRKGKCEECVEHHKLPGKRHATPFCQRSEEEQNAAWLKKRGRPMPEKV